MLKPTATGRPLSANGENKIMKWPTMNRSIHAFRPMGLPRQRRGITLLFVLSLIVLFLLMGASFVLIASQFRRSATVLGRMHVRQDDARSLVSRAFYDLLREPDLNNANSPLRGHSILGDMYGYGGVSFVRAAEFQSNSSNQIVNLELDLDNNAANGDQFQPILGGIGTSSDFVDYSGAYDGMILTFTDGPAAGISCRIVAYTVNTNAAAPPPLIRGFQIIPAWNDQVAAFLTPLTLVGSRVVINNRPFTGSGAGAYNPNTRIDTPALSFDALLPNRIGESLAQFRAANGYVGLAGSALGNSNSTNEDYDAVDFQNMFLAGRLNDGTIIPSFARETLEAATSNASQSVFRAFNPGAYYPPDVDNDMDGINDGHFMDIGLPVQTDMKGKVYKPLVSYHVLDMDGRLNVNTHGNLAQIPSNNYFKTDLGLLETFYGSGIPGTALSLGAGYGPAEVNPNFIPGFPLANVLLGTAAWSGRYGVDGVPGAPLRDASSAYKLFGHPEGAFNTGGLVGNLFASPMDIHGRLGYGSANLWKTGLRVDPYDTASLQTAVPVGMPITNIDTSLLVNEILNSPYEADFTAAPFVPSPSAVDTPFSPSELEGLLRSGDTDRNMMAPRLRALVGENFRNIVTTDSFEVPVPPTHLVDKLREILLSRIAPPPTVPTEVQRQFIDDSVRLLLPAEVRRGQRMNINRSFGNGLDDGVTNAAQGRRIGVIDEPGEGISGTEIMPDPYGRTIAMDLNGDGIQGGPFEGQTRQDFARHLYMVTLLTTQWVDRNGDGNVTLADWYDYDGNGSVEVEDLLAYRRDVAQWAINVVDFRDPDSIMTGFEFDLDPWDGWNVDGDLTTDEGADRGVVWGAERPELLLTESFATHQRRTTDTSADSDNTPGQDLAGGDDDLDSQLVPNTSAYFELFACSQLSGYSTANINNRRYPPELYGTDGLDLQRTSLDGTSPVWRLSVRRRYDGDVTPDEADDDASSIASNEIRRVYFVQPNASVDTGPEVFYPDGLTLPELPVGEYAVVGGGIRNGARYDHYLGRRNTITWETELVDTRRISLVPGASFAANRIELRYWDGANWQTQQRNALAIPVNQPNPNYEGNRRPFGITEPVNGYAALVTAGVLEIRQIADGFQFFDVATSTPYVYDQPVDQQLMPAEWIDFNTNGTSLGTSLDSPALAAAGIRDDGLYRRHSAVYLQRLANPLLPFNALSNPYITVDGIGNDITIFNGATSTPEQDATPGILPNLVASVERGTNDVDFARKRFLWKSNLDGRYVAETATRPELDTTAPGDLHYLSFNVANSLGEIDQVYRFEQNNFPAPWNSAIDNVALPWLNWNDRPYVSHLEMTLVPYSGAYGMLSTFDLHDPSKNAYDGGPGAGLAPVHAGQFGHLFGFHTDQFSNPSAGGQIGSPALHRVLDYLEVPSRYVGVEKYLNPAQFGVGGPGSANAVALGISPPNNSLSNYRYPGKINLNTLFSEGVYNSLMGPYSAIVPYANFDQNRRSTGPVYPTDYPWVYRNAESANLVPPVSSGTLITSSSGHTLFRNNDPGMPISGTPLFDSLALSGAHNDPSRSAYFRYDMRQRLGNMVTNRSSVFAVWITVGFFEVDPVTGQPVNIEVGADDGTTKRYRGFFLVDRSIPVAFEPGRDHNVDRAVLSHTIMDD